MEPEIKPSLSARISARLRRLRETLISFLALVASLFSRLLAQVKKLFPKGSIVPSKDKSIVNHGAPADQKGKRENGIHSSSSPDIQAEPVSEHPASKEPKWPTKFWRQVRFWVVADTKKIKTERIKFVVEIALALAVLYVYRGQLTEMQNSTKAAQDAAVAAKSAAATADETLKSSKQQFITEERPYVFAQPVAVGPLEFNSATGKRESVVEQQIGNNFRFNIAVQITNGGKSPAVYLMATKSEMKIGPKDDARKQAMNFVEEYPRGNIILAPGVSNTVPTEIARSLTFTEAGYLIDGSWEIYVVGAVKYSDLISHQTNPKILPYKTSYCFKYIPTGLVFGNCGFGSSIK